MTMSTDLQAFLEELGLSAKETELYLYSLRNGRQTASTIAKRTGIARSTVNFVFDQLIQKGFANKEVQEKTTYFQVVEPESLEYILLERSMRSKKQLSDLKDLLPDFKKIKNPNPLLPKVTYYEGLDSLYRTLEDCCSRDESVYFISSHNNMHPQVREFVERVYIPKSKKHKNKNKMILSDGETARAYLKKAEGVYDEVLFIDPKSNPFKITLAVHGNKVDMISYDASDLSGVVIENALIAEHMRVIFNIVKNHFKKA